LAVADHFFGYHAVEASQGAASRWFGMVFPSGATAGPGLVTEC